MSRQNGHAAGFAVGCALLLGLGLTPARVDAQAQTPAPAPAAAPATNPPGSLCSITVELPAAPAEQGARAGGPGGAGPAAAPAATQTQLVKIKDDVYVIQNPEHTLAQIGPLGGNVTIYLTNDGVILFDSKNERMHDDVVAKVRSLTDKPIKYVVLTHNHADHAGGAARMQAVGATVISSADAKQNMLRRTNQPDASPVTTYQGSTTISLGGKGVDLREFCGHTKGDTVAYLPAARVVVAGDLVTTPDAIPPIVNYGDGGTWTDLGRTLDEIANMDFDFLVGGHGPVLTALEFMDYRDKVFAIRERLRELNRKGTSEDDIRQTLLNEYNYGTGPGAAQIALMMIELKGPRVFRYQPPRD